MDTLREIDVPGGLSLFLRTGTNNHPREAPSTYYNAELRSKFEKLSKEILIENDFGSTEQ